jgi:hypothetical protein
MRAVTPRPFGTKIITPNGLGFSPRQRLMLPRRAGYWTLTAAGVAGAVTMARACTGGRRRGSEPVETRGGAPVPGAGGTLDHG